MYLTFIIISGILKPTFNSHLSVFRYTSAPHGSPARSGTVAAGTAKDRPGGRPFA